MKLSDTDILGNALIGSQPLAQFTKGTINPAIKVITPSNLTEDFNWSHTLPGDTYISNYGIYYKQIGLNNYLYRNNLNYKLDININTNKDFYDTSNSYFIISGDSTNQEVGKLLYQNYVNLFDNKNPDFNKFKSLLDLFLKTVLINALIIEINSTSLMTIYNKSESASEIDVIKRTVNFIQNHMLVGRIPIYRLKRYDNGSWKYYDLIKFLEENTTNNG